jgi:hypothetical protein
VDAETGEYIIHEITGKRQENTMLTRIPTAYFGVRAVAEEAKAAESESAESKAPYSTAAVLATAGGLQRRLSI